MMNSLSPFLVDLLIMMSHIMHLEMSSTMGPERKAGMMIIIDGIKDRGTGSLE